MIMILGHGFLKFLMSIIRCSFLFLGDVEAEEDAVLETFARWWGMGNLRGNEREVKEAVFLDLGC